MLPIAQSASQKDIEALAAMELAGSYGLFDGDPCIRYSAYSVENRSLASSIPITLPQAGNPQTQWVRKARCSSRRPRWLTKQLSSQEGRSSRPREDGTYV